MCWLRLRPIRHPRTRISEAYDSMKTGDILLFSSLPHNYTNSFVHQNYYSHCAMVIRKGGRLYLAESSYRSSLGHKRRDGTAILPMLSYLKNYWGVAFHMPLSDRLSPGKEDAVVIEASKEFDYPGFTYILVQLIGIGRPQLLGLGFEDLPVHCFSWVGHLMDVAGLTPKDETSFGSRGWSEVCSDICALSGKKLWGGYSYGEPREILYDIPPPEGQAESAKATIHSWG